MSVKNRVEKLEKRVGIDEGYIYFVMSDNGKFTVRENGADILEDVEMSEKEFAEWENSISKNSVVYVVTRYEDGEK
jgi:hypothetical protein